MVSQELLITNAIGLHARPAGVFVKTAQQFTSTVTLQKGDKRVDAKSLFAVMGAAVKSGDTVVVECDGEDEQAALDALAQAVQDGLGEG